MKKTLSLAVVMACNSVAVAGLVEDFKAVQGKGDEKAVRAFVEKAEETAKDDPDSYAVASGYWWNASEVPHVSTQPAEKGDFSIRDKETGDEVGSLSFSERDQKAAARAVKLLEEGVAKFPHRADLVLGLANIQFESEKYADCVETLDGLLAIARERPDSLKWTGNEPLPEPVKEFVPESLQSYTGNLFNSEQEELCGQLCDKIITAFPDHGFAYNMKAALADSQGKPDEMLRYLELARSKSPDDVLILLNLGDVYAKRGMKEKATKAFKRVLEIDGDEDIKEQAKEALKELEGKTD